MGGMASIPDLLTTKRIGVITGQKDSDKHSAKAIVLKQFFAACKSEGIQISILSSPEDFIKTIQLDIDIDGLVLDGEILADDTDDKRVATLLDTTDELYSDLPVFVMADRAGFPGPWEKFLDRLEGVVYIYEDTPDFIVGRIAGSVSRYQKRALPPFFSAMRDFALHHEYSWHTPGHTGGTAFLRSPVGKKFFDFFGEELFRSDLSISVGELGSLLDHSGPLKDAEAAAAKIFGADRTYFVTNGTSTSNRVVFGAVLADGDKVLVDRNCHKSVEHALTLTGAKPTYMVPTRNSYGIIGPIPSKDIKQTIEGNQARHMVITNSTYDGLCYNVQELENIAASKVPVLHFDEAWYGYARFNPIYRGRFAMHQENRADKPPTVLATQSSHKLLAALSQASYIHLREGEHPLPHSQFNESFMMHASTSPQYAIIASNDVAAKMMEGKSGQRLTTESIEEAVDFRLAMVKTYMDKRDKNDWWFGIWQPDKSASGDQPFGNVPKEELVTNPSHWTLRPNDAWHGFGDIEENWCMLDPIKVTIITPGLNREQGYYDRGIPAALVTKFLDTRSIVVEKTGDYVMLFLFSMGVTKGKWATLMTALHEFKQAYDQNQPVKEIFPDLVEESPEVYEKLGLRDLANSMHDLIRQNRFTDRVHQAFASLPNRALSPREAYKRLVDGQAKFVTLDEAAGKIAATGLVPYPPGIPMIMPGEELGGSDDAYLGYLRALENFDRTFPGFDHDTHGITVQDGRYHLWCLEPEIEQAKEPRKEGLQ